jgi:hypothetical protein
MEDIPDKYRINDLRNQPEFRGISFSKYKKSDVKKQFIQNMMNGKIEPACYWCAELICAGHYSEIWEDILYYVGKYIHIANPKIIIYLEKRYEMFQSILDKNDYIKELQLRNNPKIRLLFAEVISIITLSVKHNSFEKIKINREEEFDITQMSERFKAPSIEFVEPVFHPSDPKELFIPINEFSYHISGTKKNMLSACYWIEWIIEFDIICKKRKQPLYCKRRAVDVDIKFQTDIIWLIWDSLLYYVSELNNPYIDSLIRSLKNIFCIKYTTTSCKKRKYLLYFAVELLTTTVPTNIELIQNKQLVTNVIEKINEIYEQIKENEVNPRTDYLFYDYNLDNKN